MGLVLLILILLLFFGGGSRVRGTGSYGDPIGIICFLLLILVLCYLISWFLRGNALWGW